MLFWIEELLQKGNAGSKKQKVCVWSGLMMRCRKKTDGSGVFGRQPGDHAADGEDRKEAGKPRYSAPYIHARGTGPKEKPIAAD